MDPVADPGGALEAQAPLPLLKLVKKRWPLLGAASFASHQPPSDKFLDLLLGPELIWHIIS